MLRKSLFSITSAISLLLIFSCETEKSGLSTNDDITRDLQKIASVVDNISFALEKRSDNLEKKLQRASYSCFSLQPGIEVCSFEEDGFLSIDTTYLYKFDGITPTDFDSLAVNESYKMKYNSYMECNRYKAWMNVMQSVKYTVIDEFSNTQCDYSITGSGKIDYFNDDLILDIPLMTSSITSDSTGEYYNYEYQFSIMDGKYLSEIKGTDTITLDCTFDSTAVCASGPLTTNSGEKVGTLELINSGDVRILDIDGNIVKKTGN